MTAFKCRLESAEMGKENKKSETRKINFKSKPRSEKVDKDLVFIGDSIIKHVKLNLVNPDKTNELCCIPGADISRIEQEIIKADEKYNMKKLALHVGSNEIPINDPEKVAHKLVNLIKATKKQMPDTELYFSAILPKISSSYNPGINYINQFLYNSSKTDNFTFVQHPQFSRNGIINFDNYARVEVQSNRAIHLSKGGVARLACNIRYAIKDKDR